MGKLKLLFIVFISGALLGFFFDSIHVYYNVLQYTEPHIFGESLWVFPEFGFAAVQFYIFLSIIKWKYGAFQPTNMLNCLYNALLLLAAYIINGIFVGQNLLTLALMVPLAAVSIIMHNDKKELIIILLTSTYGPISEYYISSSGFFKYNYGTPVIPYWLPVLWVIAGGLFLEANKYIFQWEAENK